MLFTYDKLCAVAVVADGGAVAVFGDGSPIVVAFINSDLTGNSAQGDDIPSSCLSYCSVYTLSSTLACQAVEVLSLLAAGIHTFKEISLYKTARCPPTQRKVNASNCSLRRIAHSSSHQETQTLLCCEYWSRSCEFDCHICCCVVLQSRAARSLSIHLLTPP